ncbi:MAG: hypothetical protein JKY45_12185 [Emcibacter sp.]|nr:hypothetical protein [Emcibacter sp.]
MTVSGEHILAVDDVKHVLRLGFKEAKQIEVELAKSLIHVNALSFYEMSFCLSVTTGMTAEEAFEIIKYLGLEAVALAIKTLIMGTFSPGKKSQKPEEKLPTA